MTEAIQDKSRNVNKILIAAFPAKGMKGSPASTFTVPINPEQFSQKFEIKTDTQSQGTGTESNSPKYALTPPEELKLDFFLDHTNTVTGNTLNNQPIPKQVQSLLNTVYKMNPDTHRPYFLKIGWNDQAIFGENKTVFECQLKSIDINYVLFNPQGEPLRAKVSAVFTAYTEDEKRTKQEGKSSPDLTHVRTATPADQLWLMTHRIYEDPKYILQVAKANNFNTLRHLNAGTEVVFPPFERNETV